MLIKLYEDKIPTKHLEMAIKSLENDGLLLTPTDTLYAFVVDVHSHKAARLLADLKGKKLEKSNFSIVCSSLSMASKYIKPLSNNQFSFIKNLNIEQFTFVLNANNLIPKIFQNKRKTIGIRIARNNVLVSIIEALARPLLITSVSRQGNDEEIYENAELIYEKYSNSIDMAFDIGEIANIPSTVIDMTNENDYEIIRQGLGKI